MELINLSEYEEAARARLTSMVYDYYAGGAVDEVTVRENRAAFERLQLYPRVLRGISERDVAITLLDQSVAFPILVAPTGFQAMAHPDGELATARAAGALGTIMILSTASNYAVEEVLAAASGPVWFQLYVYRDREITRYLVQRAEAAGCSALVVTVDTPTLGHRERDVRNHFQLPPGLSMKNFEADASSVQAGVAGSGLASYTAHQFDPDLSWDDIDWLRSFTKLPILLKGILHPDDARLALDYDVAGLIVSNHGGRQLDTAPATITALPSIAKVVEGRLPLLLDGGVRRGTDVVKAIALGASAVAVGRPILWGLTVDGETGVCTVLNMLRDDFSLAMGLCGCRSVAEIGRNLLLNQERPE